MQEAEIELNAKRAADNAKIKAEMQFSMSSVKKEKGSEE